MEQQTEQTLTYKPQSSPTIFNKEMAIGALAGVTIPIPGVNLLAALGIAAGMGAIGGMIGSGRMKNEQENGKAVSNKPSFWNKSAVIGGLVGLNAGFLGSVLTTVGAAAGAVALGATAPAATTLAAVAMVGTWIAGAVIGTRIGGKHGQKHERVEFQAAQAQQQSQARGQGQGYSFAQEQGQEVGQGFAQRVEEERARAAQYQQGR